VLFAEFVNLFFLKTVFATEIHFLFTAMKQNGFPDAEKGLPLASPYNKLRNNCQYFVRPAAVPLGIYGRILQGSAERDPKRLAFAELGVFNWSLRRRHHYAIRLTDTVIRIHKNADLHNQV